MWVMPGSGTPITAACVSIDPRFGRGLISSFWAVLCSYDSLRQTPSTGGLNLYECRCERADERTRTADLLQLRVISQVLQGVARACKCRMFRGVSLPCLAMCCTVLRSRWYQSGINVTLLSNSL